MILSGVFVDAVIAGHCPTWCMANVVFVYPRAARKASEGVGLKVRANEPQISTLT